MDWNQLFEGEPTEVMHAIERVRGARAELERLISLISTEKDDPDAPLSPAARWTRNEQFRHGYERQCKLVAGAEVELLRAVLSAQRRDTRQSPSSPSVPPTE